MLKQSVASTYIPMAKWAIRNSRIDLGSMSDKKMLGPCLVTVKDRILLTASGKKAWVIFPKLGKYGLGGG
jgi:hypothetical protein